MIPPDSFPRAPGKDMTRTFTPEAFFQRGTSYHTFSSMMSSARSLRGVVGIKPWPGNLMVTLMWPWSRSSTPTSMIQRISPCYKSEFGASWLSLMLGLWTPSWRPPWFWSQGRGTYTRFCGTHPDPQELASKLCIPGCNFVLNAEGAPWKLLRKDLTALAQTWSVLLYSNLTPTSHTSNLNMDRAKLVYGLVMKMDMNLDSLISGQISQMAQSNSSRLGFPTLITSLCIAWGVVPDSLTFESLSLAINLAYIRKNC